MSSPRLLPLLAAALVHGASLHAQQAPPSGDGGPATQARLMAPAEVRVDREGNVYVTERSAYRVRRIDARSGAITTFAGTGERGYSGDGGPATRATLAQQSGIGIDADGNVYLGDLWNHRIRRIDARTGVITTIAGTGEPGFSGDGGPAALATVQGVFDIDFDRAGNLYFADTDNHRIRRIDARSGVVTTVAGDGQRDFGGDGGPATRASLARPHCVMVMPNDDLVICDSFNLRIRRVDARTGIITTIAGTGRFGAAGDGGPATRANVTYVGDFALDPSGSILFSDIATHRIRRIDARTGIIGTIAGTGRWEVAGDGGPASAGSFHMPVGIEYDREGNLLVVDSWGGRVRRIDGRTGRLSTIAGSADSPETPDWRFHAHYDPVAWRAGQDRPVVVRHEAMDRVRVVEARYARAGEDSGAVSVFLPPPGATDAMHPVMLLAHARTNHEVRPQQSGGMRSWARLLAAHGVVAVLPDHRLGMRNASAALGTDDLRAALALVRGDAGRFGADAGRTCVLAFADGVGAALPLLDDAGMRCLVAWTPLVDLTGPTIWAWTGESADVRRERSLLARLEAGRASRTPLVIVRARGDTPEVLEPLARLERVAVRDRLPVTFLDHPGGADFERDGASDDDAWIVRRAVALLLGHLR